MTNTDPNPTELCRDRMLASALNFAIGFFGYPYEGQYQQSITIEARGVSPPSIHPSSPHPTLFPVNHADEDFWGLQFNNTLAPYKTSVPSPFLSSSQVW